MMKRVAAPMVGGLFTQFYFGAVGLSADLFNLEVADAFDRGKNMMPLYHLHPMIVTFRLLFSLSE